MRASRALLAVACIAAIASALSSPRVNGLRRRTFINGIEVDLSNLTSISTGIPSITGNSALPDKLPQTSSVSIPDKDKHHDKSTTLPVFPDKDSNSTSVSSPTAIPDKDKDKTTSGTVPSKDATTTSVFLPSSSAFGFSDTDKPSSVVVTVSVNKTVSIIPVPPSTASVTLRPSSSLVSVESNITATIPDKEETTASSLDDKTTTLTQLSTIDTTVPIASKDETTVSASINDKTTYIASASTTSNATASVPDKDKPTRSLTSGRTGVPSKDLTGSLTHYTTFTVSTETISLIPMLSNNQSLTLTTLTPTPTTSESGTPSFCNNSLVVGPSSYVGSETSVSSSTSVSYSVVLQTLTLPGPSGSPTVIVVSGTSPAVPTETPESTGVALTWTEIQSLETISLPQTTTSGSGNDKDSSRTETSPPTTASSGESSSGSTTLVVPLWTPDMLGSAYGGGYITTPSIYVTLSGTPGFTEGVPPGYGSTFRPTTSHSGFAITTRTRPVSRSTSLASTFTAPFANSTIPSVTRKSSTTDDKDQIPSETDKPSQSKDQTTALATTDKSSKFEDKTSTVSTTSEPSKTEKQTQPSSDKTSNTDDKVSTTTATTTVVSYSSTNELGSTIQTSITLVRPTSSTAVVTKDTILLTTSASPTSAAAQFSTIVAPTQAFSTATTVFITTLRNSAGSVLTFSSTFTALVPAAQTTVSPSAEISSSIESNSLGSSVSAFLESTAISTQTPVFSNVVISSPIGSITSGGSIPSSADFTTQSSVLPSAELPSTSGSTLIESTLPSVTTRVPLPTGSLTLGFLTPAVPAGSIATTSSILTSGPAVISLSSSTGSVPAISSTSRTEGEATSTGLSVSLVVSTPSAPFGSVVASSNALTAQTEGTTAGESTPVTSLTITGTPTIESLASTSSEITNIGISSIVDSTGPANVASNTLTPQGSSSSTSVEIPIVVPFTTTNLAGTVLTTSSTSTLSLPASAVGVPPSVVIFTTTDKTGSVSASLSTISIQEGSSSVVPVSSTSSPLQQGSPFTRSSIAVASTTTNPAGSVITTSNTSTTQGQGSTPTESPVVIVYNTTNPAGSLTSTTSTATALVPSSTSNVVTSSEQTVTSENSVLSSIPTISLPTPIAASTVSSFEQSVGPVSSLSSQVSSQPLDTITLPGGNPFPEPTSTVTQPLSTSEGVQSTTGEATDSILSTSLIPGVPSLPGVTPPAALQPESPVVTDFGSIVVNGSTFAISNPTPTAVPFEGSAARISPYSIAAIAGIIAFLCFP